MHKSRFVVEIDVDGVLGDMDGSYAPHVEYLIPDFSEEKYIKEWGIPEVKRDYPEAFGIIMALYKDPEFIRNLKRYEGVEKALKNIYALTSCHGGEIIVHTHIFTPECAAERRLWLEKLERDAGVKFNIDICVGDEKKTKRNSLVLIEDNVRNLYRSSASYKILLSRGHNRNYGVEALGDYDRAYKAKDLNEAYLYLKDILENPCHVISV